MKNLALFVFSLALVACGGGGGSAPAGKVTSTETFQLKQAFANFFNDTKPETFAITGSVTSVTGGVTLAGTVAGNGSVTSSAVTSATFEGVAGLQKTRYVGGNITVSANGTSANQSLPAISSTSYATASFLPLGSTSPSSYSITTGTVAVPATGKVGDTGTIANFVTYASAAKGVSTGSSVLTFSMEADTATTAIFKMTETSTNAVGAPIGSTSYSYRMTAAGAITHLTDTTTATVVSGASTVTTTLVFTY